MVWLKTVDNKLVIVVRFYVNFNKLLRFVINCGFFYLFYNFTVNLTITGAGRTNLETCIAYLWYD